MRKKVCIGIMAIVAIMALVSIKVFSSRDKDKGEIDKTTEALIVNGNRVQYEKSDSEELLFSAVQSNWSGYDITMENWESSTWKVYYNGKVEYHENYTLMGESNSRTWTLTDSKYSLLLEYLNDGFYKYNKDTDSACDGCGWGMNYYDQNGDVLHSYYGYIYSKELLNKIVEILVVPEIYEDTDDLTQAVNTNTDSTEEQLDTGAFTE